MGIVLFLFFCSVFIPLPCLSPPPLSPLSPSLSFCLCWCLLFFLSVSISIQCIAPFLVSRFLSCSHSFSLSPFASFSLCPSFSLSLSLCLARSRSLPLALTLTLSLSLSLPLALPLPPPPPRPRARAHPHQEHHWGWFGSPKDILSMSFAFEKPSENAVNTCF